jgi:hypothetical protein
MQGSVSAALLRGLGFTSSIAGQRAGGLFAAQSRWLAMVPPPDAALSEPTHADMTGMNDRQIMFTHAILALPSRRVRSQASPAVAQCVIQPSRVPS